MPINLPETERQRIIIIGAGFAGFTLAKKMVKSDYQVVLIDRNNYHQFQPLLYQVAMAGLEPSSIAFPLRKSFQKHKHIHIRRAEVLSVNPDNQSISTSLGIAYYDKLVFAMGATTNYFGMKGIQEHTISLKSIGESLYLRNTIFEDLENAVITRDFDDRQGLIDIVVVGGGPTGVELAGALAEMKTFIIPKDYPELDAKEIDIHLIQSGDRILKTMSDKASDASLKFLKELGVLVHLNSRVVDCDGNFVYLKDGTKFRANKVIWTAGITCKRIEGLPEKNYAHANRLKVKDNLELVNEQNIYCIGDQAYLETADHTHGHPQVAQAAIQMANHLHKTLVKENVSPFKYKDKGSMATIGRNKAVADIGNMKLTGFVAWVLWLVVHLFSITGAKNRIFTFLNWVWNYFTLDQSLRLIIKATKGK